MPFLGANRTEAVWRILGLAWFATIGWLVIAIAGAAALVWMVVDVLLQLATGGAGLTSGNAAGGFLKRLWRWGNGQVRYVLFGEGSFPILP